MKQFWLVGLVGFLTALSAHATVFAQRPFTEVVEETPVIVRGRVEKSAPSWVTTKSGAKRIYTFTEVTITDVVKGEVQTKTLKFREIGGEVEGVGLDIVGAAKFKDGEDIVIMLEQNTSGVEPGAQSKLFNLRGLMMGKLNVVKDADGNEILKGPALQGETPWSMDRLRSVASQPAKPPASADSAPVKLVYSHGEPGEADGLHSHAEPAPAGEEPSEFGKHTNEKDAKSRIVLYVLLAGFIVIRTIRRSQKKKNDAIIK